MFRLFCYICFFFFKQKTAYEMRISDWSSDVCSSDLFRDVMYEVMPDDWKIPQSRWFTNLAEKGNVGSASFYLLLDGLLQSGQLKAGQRVLCFVPESGRFSIAFVCLTVVAA